MKTLIALALLTLTAPHAEAKEKTALDACISKAQATYRADMKRLELDTKMSDEERGALTQYALTTLLDNKDACEDAQKRNTQAKSASKHRIPAGGFSSCAEDYQCQMDKIDAMGGGGASLDANFDD